MENIIAVIVIAVVIIGAAAYVIKSKKRGRKCIGCPYCDSCNKQK